MKNRRITPWYRSANSSFPFLASVLVPIDARYIPLSLRDLEAWKSPALWSDPADYAEAYDALCKQGAALLMDVTDRLISEVRATRAGTDTGALERDPAADPYTLPLPTLGSVQARLTAPDGRTAAEVLVSIEAKIEASGANSEDILEQLQLVALLLGA